MKDIKELTRDRMEVRIHAQETMMSMMEWIGKLKPSEWLPASKDNVISDDELKAQWRDYVDNVGKLMTKGWKPINLVMDDLTSFLEGIFAEDDGALKG